MYKDGHGIGSDNEDDSKSSVLRISLKGLGIFIAFFAAAGVLVIAEQWIDIHWRIDLPDALPVFVGAVIVAVPIAMCAFLFPQFRALLMGAQHE
jgi:uncharacterized membrane protein YidH (DUF202 family)